MRIVEVLTLILFALILSWGLIEEIISDDEEDMEEK